LDDPRPLSAVAGVQFKERITGHRTLTTVSAQTFDWHKSAVL